MGYGGFYFDTALDRFRKWRFSPFLSLGGTTRRQQTPGRNLRVHLGGSLTYVFDSGKRFGVNRDPHLPMRSSTTTIRAPRSSPVVHDPFDGVTSVQRQIRLALAER